MPVSARATSLSRRPVGTSAFTGFLPRDPRPARVPVGLSLQETRLPARLSRDLPATVTALLHGEIDAGFGRVYPLAPHDEDRLTSRLARLEPVDAVFGADHLLACRPEMCPADPRDSVLWCPAALSRLDFLRHFAERFSIRPEEGGANLGLDQLIERLRADPGGSPCCLPMSGCPTTRASAWFRSSGRRPHTRGR